MADWCEPVQFVHGQIDSSKTAAPKDWDALQRQQVRGTLTKGHIVNANEGRWCLHCREQKPPKSF